MKRRTVNTSAVAAFIGYAFVPTSAKAGSGDRRLFISRAVEHPDNSVTLPMYRGTSNGEPVWYLLLDTSDGEDAQRLGINRASKLENARGSAAVMKVRVVDGVIDFPASVDFSRQRQVMPGPMGFPPAQASPGPVGQMVNGIAYSPLIEMPNGTIRNAPHISNTTGRAAKARSLDTVARTVRFVVSPGFSGGKAVNYISTEASAPDVAALENVTHAAALASLPTQGSDGSDSARVGLVAFANGQTGAGNPQRQGLNSALLEGLDPLNVLRRVPNQGGYTPMWDVYLAQWTGGAIANGLNLRQTDWGQVINLVNQHYLTGPGGAMFGAVGVVVNCPVISQAG